MRKISRLEAIGSCALLLGVLLACVEGGANANQKKPGDQPGGIALGMGEIAVSPVANFVLFERDDRLAVGWIATGAIFDLPVTAPSRLAFSKQRPAVYVGTETSSELLAVDVNERRVLWRAGIEDARTERLKLAASATDGHVVAASMFGVQTFDAASGVGSGSFEVAGGVVDVEILPDSRRVLVVEQHKWLGDSPSTRLLLMNLETKLTVSIQVPNCADDIVVSGDGRFAFLAPTTCQKDPISVIDLTEGAEKFVKNLPGFGPLALAPDGVTAVGFVDRDNIDLSLFDDPSQAPTESSDRYHLMLLDTVKSSYELVPSGDSLPRFAITPDGNVLLVDSAYLLLDRARLFDVPSRSFKEISGPSLHLGTFALSSDSKHAYVLENGLFDIDIPAAAASQIELPFTPKNLNISADDQLLFLRKSSSEICIFELQSRSCQRAFVSVSHD
jgi:DNA-binding beta-propeller fold protein YncE